MGKSSSIIRIKARTVKELRTKKLLNEVSMRLKGKELFPEKVENAKDFFRRLHAHGC